VGGQVPVGSRACNSLAFGIVPAKGEGEVIVRLRLVVGGLVLLGLVSGCTAKSATPAPSAAASASEVAAASAPPWTEPAKYGFVLDRQCNRGPSMGRYRVAVENGQVVKADRIDGRTAEGEEEIEVPSLAQLLDLAQTAADDGGEVTTKFDAADGHPVAVSFNVSDQDADGAACFTVSDYQPAA
jgi:Family of unknown function (DUF6174)